MGRPDSTFLNSTLSLRAVWTSYICTFKASAAPPTFALLAPPPLPACPKEARLISGTAATLMPISPVWDMSCIVLRNSCAVECLFVRVCVLLFMCMCVLLFMCVHVNLYAHLYHPVLVANI